MGVQSKFINQWSSVISHLPRNISNFTIPYLLNNTLANGTNAIIRGITNICMFCDQQQTLGHAIRGCETALLERKYKWWHDSILLNICKTIKSQGLRAFIDIEGYPNPSIITGQRPDFGIVNKGGNLLLLELTIGFETTIKKTFDCKAKRYQELLAELSYKYKVNYANLSLGAIAIIGNNSLIMTAMKNFDLFKKTLNFIVNRTTNMHKNDLLHVLYA